MHLSLKGQYFIFAVSFHQYVTCQGLDPGIWELWTLWKGAIPSIVNEASLHMYSASPIPVLTRRR